MTERDRLPQSLATSSPTWHIWIGRPAADCVLPDLSEPSAPALDEPAADTAPDAPTIESAMEGPSHISATKRPQLEHADTSGMTIDLPNTAEMTATSFLPGMIAAEAEEVATGWSQTPNLSSATQSEARTTVMEVRRTCVQRFNAADIVLSINCEESRAERVVSSNQRKREDNKSRESSTT